MADITATVPELYLGPDNETAAINLISKWVSFIPMLLQRFQNGEKQSPYYSKL